MKKAKKIHAIQKEYKENIKRRNKLMRELEKKNAKAEKKEKIRLLFERLKNYKDNLELSDQKQDDDKVTDRTEITMMADIIDAILELSKETNIIKK